MEKYLSIEGVHALTQQFPETLPVALGLLAIFAIGGCLFFPIPLMAFAATLIFPLWKAVLISLLGVCLASSSAYLVGRFIDPERIFKKFREKIKNAKSALKKKAGWTVFALRIAPTPPFTFTSMLSGSLKISYPVYLVASVAGIMPLVLLVCIWGRQFLDFLKEPSAIVGAALLALIILIFAFSSGRIFKPKVLEN